MRLRAFVNGLIKVLPLSVAVIPWGILAGSYAIQIGMTQLESQAMSAIMFAGSAQLVATGMLQSSAGIGAILLTVAFISARHFLYGISFRERISALPLKWRILLGFLLTDEVFALCNHQTGPKFDRYHVLGVGLGFYLVWNAATFVGILLGSSVPNLTDYGLEFAVAATFIAIVVPMIMTLPQIVCVSVASIMSVLLAANDVSGSIIISSVLAMFCGYKAEKRLRELEA